MPVPFPLKRGLRSVTGGLAGVLLLAAAPALGQEPVVRATAKAGSIVAAKGGEELQFPREPSWRPAVIHQDVVGGDTLRTGEIGTLGITFADQTTIRVGRQSTLVVNQIAGAAGETELTLPAGNVWARAARGGTGVTVKTPAASAAIRGTDWSLSVQGDTTSLIVLEGVVEFANPQGSVTVRQGEGASARIGERPTKIVLVRPEDREQMLFYLELRGLFHIVPATRLDGVARRAERARLAALPPENRNAQDWVAIAENGIGYDTYDDVGLAVLNARALMAQNGARAGGRALAARLDLVEALIAGAAKQYKEAALLFGRAQGGLSGRQRITAQCGLYAARTLAEPKRVIAPPRAGGADRNVCAAFLAGFGKGLDEAATILKQSETTAPGHLLTAAMSAQVSLLLNRREDMRGTIARMRSVDPDSPETRLVSAILKGFVDSDTEGAVADLEAGLAAAPGNGSLWNTLGLVHDSREAPREAEAAFRRAIAVDPYDPVSYSNLAILLLDQSRVEEAGVLIEQALALDPAFYAAYSAKGRYLLQKGEPAKAQEFLLAGVAANPSAAQSVLALALKQYQDGDIEGATQGFDNADRLDRNDAVIAVARTAIAIDQFEADAAIVNAREAVRRYRARGGVFGGLASTRAGGSYLGQAYRLLGLEDWARYYTDRVADPFNATSFFDQAAAMRPQPFFSRQNLDPFEAGGSDAAANLVGQGLLLDPLAASGRIGRIDLLRRPFLDVEFSGSAVRRGGRIGLLEGVTVQGFSNEPVPTSVALSVSRVALNDKRVLGRTDDSRSASAYIGMAPTALDRFVLSGSATMANPALQTPTLNVFDADNNRVISYRAGGGYSHTFGHRNVLSAAVAFDRADQTLRRIEVTNGLDPLLGLFPATLNQRRTNQAAVESTTAALGHSLGLGDFTLRTGIEAVTGRLRGVTTTEQRVTVPAFAFDESDAERNTTRNRFKAGRAYANLMWQPLDALQVEGGLQAIQTEIRGQPSRSFGDPRLGIAFSPLEGHWLRAAWRRDTDLTTGVSLAPITTAGLLPHGLPLQLGGRKETTALRWDAEWTSQIFTAVEYQRQAGGRLSLTIPETVDTFDFQRGRLEYLTASANLWLTQGIGVFATVGAAKAKGLDMAGLKQELPLVPHRFARAGITFVHPSRIKISVIQNAVGARYDAPGGPKLDPLYTTDLTATYETPDRRFEIGAALYNAFDKRYDLVAARAGINEAVPGVGRTIAGSLKVRF